MYYKKAYKKIDLDIIEKDAKKEGFRPVLIKNTAGYVYEPHTHPETKLLIFLKGSMQVKIENKAYLCKPGDKLIIPRNTTHSAIVGENDCTFFWSEKTV